MNLYKVRMDNNNGWIDIKKNIDAIQVVAGGSWTIQQASQLSRSINNLGLNHTDLIELDFSQVERMDLAGACLANQLLALANNKHSVNVVSNARVDSILAIIDRYQTQPPPKSQPSNYIVTKLENIGKATVDVVDLAACFVEFIGKVFSLIATMLLHPSRFRLTLTSNQIEFNGLNAMPIIMLISFLIGVVVAYQGALQLGKLGAEVYTVNLLAVTILRELGILLTAIVIAGRSGSTFAAEIGSMKINQEIDAMQTIGLNPMEILVIPRIVSLAIALPILALIADLFGMIGGGVVAWMALDITPTLFISQLINSVSPWTFWVGLIKAPVFAVIIAVVGCYEGLQVSGSAESVGRHTTRAVVESIFLVIIFDALFSIFFGIIGI